MTEHPILFSGPMVRAILSGQKTVTRRPIKGHQIPTIDTTNAEAGLRWSAIAQRHRRYGFCVFGETEEACAHELASSGTCPYGRVGDRLWVRESLGYDSEYGHYFAAGGAHGETVYLCSLFDDEEAQAGYSYDGLLPERSVPSIHLRRCYSRILLEVTAVRVERLQNITPEQALAEGVMSAERDIDPDGNDYSPCELFGGLWVMVNGQDSWNENPWVWVVEFRRVQPCQ